MPYADDGHDVPKYVTGGDKRRRQWSHVWNSEYKRQKGKGKSDSEAESIAFASANSVTSKAATNRFAKMLEKATKDDADEFADAIWEAIQKEFLGLPADISKSLKSAMVSGAVQGMMQIESGTTSLPTANEQAEEYARDRSAEMVGKKYDSDTGLLIDNPNAEWAISETTRQAIRDIVADSFTMDTTMNEIVEDIQEALEDETKTNGIFSEARANKIARTEVMNAQAGGNFTAWKDSGVVKKVKWLTSEDEKVCPTCDDNDGVERELGKAFPSGDIHPGAHPLCRCVLIVSEVV